MRKSDAMSIMTTKVAELVNSGWVVAFDIRGSYSNVQGCMTFAKGSKRTILYIEETPDYGREIGELRVKCAEITLGEGETLERNYIWPNQWDQHITEQHTFYKVGHGDWYGTKEEAEKAQRVRRARWKAGYVQRDRKDFRVTPRVLQTVRKVYGFKTAKAENVEVYRIWDTYYIKNTKSGRTASFNL